MGVPNVVVGDFGRMNGLPILASSVERTDHTFRHPASCRGQLSRSISTRTYERRREGSCLQIIPIVIRQQRGSEDHRRRGAGSLEGLRARELGTAPPKGGYTVLGRIEESGIN
jgi:hypothetical protein